MTYPSRPLAHRVALAVMAVALLTLVPDPALSAPDARGVALSLRAGRPSPEARAPRELLDPSSLVDGARMPAAAPDTVRLAVLLVEFPEDDDPATTGDGRFQRTFSDEYPTNRPPHDRAYFDRQCQAVRSYFSAASSGRLTLEWTIYPDGSDPLAAFEMPQRMRYYNPDTTEAALDRRLAEFLRDAVVAADGASGGSLPFDAYDHAVIIHAGVGQDLLFDDPTPSDIPSAFLSATELAEFLGEGPDYPGIPVQNGTHFVREGLWIPETENQEGIEFALTGVFAQLLGSQLGLPILFNPDSGAPGIGRFGLMDQGGGNVSGISPAFPCAWSRFDRGWAEAEVVLDATDVRIKALGALGAGAELVLIPVDEREYFLLEYRKKDVDGDGEFAIVIEPDDDNRVPTGIVSDEYDYGIPGSGLLIWHIDQAVIDASRAENRVNADYTHRGVKLLEADGLDDIGLRPEGGFGLPEDAFFAGNNDALTPTSTPSSASNYDALTHVTVSGVSDTTSADLVMSCDVANDAVLSGWPSRDGSAYGAAAPATGDVNGDGNAEIVAVDDSTTIVIFGSSGVREASFTVPFDPGSSDWIVGLLVVDVVAEGAPGGRDEIVVSGSDGSVTVYDGAFDVLAQPLPRIPGSGSLSAGSRAPVRGAQVVMPMVGASDLDGDDTAELVIAGDGGGISIWDEVDGTTAVSLPYGDDTVHAGGTDGEMGDLALIAVSGAGRVVGFERTAIPGNPYVVALDDETGSVPAHPPVFGDLDRDGTAEMVIVSDDGHISAHRLILEGAGAGVSRLERLDGWPVALDAPVGPPALGDVNGDGRPDVIVADASRLRAFAFNGVRLEGWPVSLIGRAEPGAIRTQPLVADVDADGRQDVILAAPDGLLRGFDGGGRVLPGWPLPAGRPHAMAPVVSAIAGGGVVVAGAGSPWLYGFAATGAADGAHWPVTGGGAGRSGVLPTSVLGAVGAPDPLFPEGTVSVYPNPASRWTRFRYFLEENANIEILLYDTSALEIARLGASGQGGVMNELLWDLTNEDGDPVAPGLYLARIVARGSGRTITHDIKLAVFR